MSTKKIIVSISEQKVRLYEGEKQLAVYTCSSALNGTGCEVGSNKTPLGNFTIHKKIGHGAEKGTVFRARVATSEMCTNEPENPLWQSPKDLVLSRILWLAGADSENANTLGRYIYLHGTNQEHLLGEPASHGCIRLSNKDIVDLFDKVEEGTSVVIKV
jgi:lipoprotein-anchoring transpeptidase ErfK/SrfK